MRERTVTVKELLLETVKYKYAVIATDTIIFSLREKELKVLLIKMKKEPFQNCWAAPGGLVRGDESLNDAANRNLYETTGVKDVYLEQLYTFGRVDRDPFGRVVSVAYFALINHSETELTTTDAYEAVRWFSVNRLPKLAYDHDEMVQYAFERLKAKLEYTNIVFGLLPDEFTLSELQQCYEIILDRKLDKRNFRKKILSLKLVESTGRRRRGMAHRPAMLYRFRSRKYQVIQIL